MRLLEEIRQSRTDAARVTGVPGAISQNFPLCTEDGLTLGLTRFRRAASDRVVLLIHGLTSSSSMFALPEHENLVTTLLDSGFSDVWCLDWRGSCQLEHNRSGGRYTLDDVALMDIPACVDEIRRHTGSARIHVIAHCVGAIATAMSACAGLLGPLQSLTCAQVFLVPRLSPASEAKLLLLPELVGRWIQRGYVPIALEEAGLLSRMGPIFMLAAAAHRSCTDPTCQVIQFMWGSGRSPVFEHRNLSPATHGRLRELFGDVPLCYFDHLRRMVVAGRVVRAASGARYDALPQNYLANAERIRAPILLLSGDRGGVWGNSNRVAFELLATEQPTVNATLLEIPGYGHQDLFIGQHAALDVYPHIVSFLESADRHTTRSHPLSDDWKRRDATPAG
jgi:cholesterol oxidase